MTSFVTLGFITSTLTSGHERIIEAQITAGQSHSLEELLDRALPPFKQSRPETTAEEKIGEAQAAAERIRNLRKGAIPSSNRPRCAARSSTPIVPVTANPFCLAT